MKLVAWSLALTFVVLVCPAAVATHTNTGNASYVGDLHEDGIFDEVTLTDGADWFVLNLVKDQPVTLTIERGDVGDLIPNASIFDGIAQENQTIAEAGLTELLFSPLTNNNSLASSVTGGFVPTITGQYTLIVTTWTGQNGTYDLAYTGFGPEVPEPATACLAMLSTLGLACLRRRR